MKIAIFTLPPRENYGGIIQSYALQTVLERMGHEVEILDEPYKPQYVPAWQMGLRIGKRLVFKYILRRKCHIFIEHEMEKLRPVRWQHLERFMSQYLHRKVYKTWTEIKESDYDAYVVGSDQIWRRKYNKLIEYAYLSFTDGWNVRRIAYAASFGIDNWDYSKLETKKCAEAIKNFRFVSVREHSGIELCKKYLNADAHWVVDPTLLLNTEDYEKLIEARHLTIQPNTLFAYVLDESSAKRNLINKIAKEKNLDIYEMTSPDSDINDNIEGLVKKPIESWLNAFRQAEFVVTDSFHACVFSIIFNKPFVVVGNAERGLTRFHSLLKKFDLSDHLILSAEDYMSSKSYAIAPNIAEILKQEAAHSIAFLKGAIEAI